MSRSYFYGLLIFTKKSSLKTRLYVFFIPPHIKLIHYYFIIGKQTYNNYFLFLFAESPQDRLIDSMTTGNKLKIFSKKKIYERTK